MKLPKASNTMDPAVLFSGTRMEKKFKEMKCSSENYKYLDLLKTSALPDNVTLKHLGFKKFDPVPKKGKKGFAGSTVVPPPRGELSISFT